MVDHHERVDSPSADVGPKPTPTWPETRDELVAWFYTRPELYPRKDRASFEVMVDSALSRPDPTYTHHFRDDPDKQPPLEPARLAHMIYDFDLFRDDGRNGWIDREGRFISCSFAAHERLLELLGDNSIEAEERGWIKVRNDRPSLVYWRPSAAQVSRLKARGCKVERHVLLELHPLPEPTAGKEQDAKSS